MWGRVEGRLAIQMSVSTLRVVPVIAVLEAVQDVTLSRLIGLRHHPQSAIPPFHFFPHLRHPPAMPTSNTAAARTLHNSQPVTRHLQGATSTQQAATFESEAPCSSLLTGTAERLCAGIRVNGERCRARASGGYEFCSFHRADLQETVQNGRVQGGRHRQYELNALDAENAAAISVRLDSRGGVQGVIDYVLGEFLAGKLHPRGVHAAASLLNAALRNLDHTERTVEDHTLGQYLPSIANLAALRTKHAEERDEAARQNALDYQARVDEMLRNIEAREKLASPRRRRG